MQRFPSIINHLIILFADIYKTYGRLPMHFFKITRIRIIEKKFLQLCLQAFGKIAADNISGIGNRIRPVDNLQLSILQRRCV